MSIFALYRISKKFISPSKLRFLFRMKYFNNNLSNKKYYLFLVNLHANYKIKIFIINNQIIKLFILILKERASSLIPVVSYIAIYSLDSLREIKLFQLD
jgi:hypothetical protein